MPHSQTPSPSAGQPASSTSTEDATVGTVVVGVDGSPGSDRALTWAARQAALEGRVLCVVHGAGAGDQPWGGQSLVSVSELRDRDDAAARRLVDDAARQAAVEQPGLQVRRLPPSRADPRVVLLEAARGAHLLVVGSHGRGPVRSLLLGSVGVALTRLAPCPVAVVRPPGPGVRPQGVVVGVDLTTHVGLDADGPDGPGLHPAVGAAFALASSRSCPLTVLQCVPGPAVDDWDDWPAWDPSVAELDDTRRQAHRVRLAAAVAPLEAAHPDVAVELVVQEGSLERRLVEGSRTAEAVVVGASPLSRLRQVVQGAAATWVVEHARSVVVVVPAAASRAAGAPAPTWHGLVDQPAVT